MTLYELLRSLGATVQQVEHDIAERGLENFFVRYDGGEPTLRDFQVGPHKHRLPEGVFRHYYPMVTRRMRFDIEADVTLEEGKGLFDRLRVLMGKGRGHTRMKLHVEYGAADFAPEGVSLLHEKLINHYHGKRIEEAAND